MSASRHVRSLLQAEAVYDADLGSVRRLTVDSFPILKRMSMKRLVMKPAAIREAHWHANANELACCLSGTVLITIVDNADAVSVFTVTAGQMFYVDSGSLHAIENVGDDDAELIIVFTHEKPEDFSLHGAFGAMSDAVLGNTYDLPASEFSSLRRDTSSSYLVRREGHAEIPSTAGFVNTHKFDIEAETPPIDFPYGEARVSRTQFWPTLKDVSMYSIRIPDEGMREPHWHPNTAEMGYVHKGHARMTILDPDGSADTYLLQPGDAYFIPRAYPHQIEVLGGDIHFLVFFDQATPGDIGYRLAASALSPQVLAATFGVTPDALPEFPFTAIDPLIVAKLNPADPVS
jgi:oxalate decarboxylase